MTNLELRESTARTRELGAELRRVREAARYTGAELAKKVGWSASKVSRIENGVRGTSEVDVAIVLAYCGVLADEMYRILNLARACNDNYWLHPGNDGLPEVLRSLVVQENTADVITYYDPLVIPGLLQTEDYARALFHGMNVVPLEVIEVLVRARMDRQALLRREDPPKTWFFVHENALRLSLDDRVMHEQMLHILLQCATEPCRLRVIRDGIIDMASIGPFAFLAHTHHNPVIYTEQLTASLFLEGPENIAVYRHVLDRLHAVALGEGQSRPISLPSGQASSSGGQADDDLAEEQLQWRWSRQLLCGGRLAGPGGGGTRLQEPGWADALLPPVGLAAVSATDGVCGS